MLIAVSLMCFIHPGHSLVGPESEFPKVSRKQKKAAKAAAKAEKRAKKDGVKLLGPEGGDYAHETELEEGLHTGPQRSGQYAPMPEGGYQGYQPYGGSDVHNTYYTGGVASERALT